MALITKTDLYFTDYSWSAIEPDDPRVTGEPDSTLLNRKEGYEILYFINKLSDIWSLQNKLSAIKIEKMIRFEVPSNIHSQLNIRTWIHDNWNESRF
ncbi:hypothetical protein [Chryseobacterium sp. OV279]|uniref:hypothetical protein n=1 Tax=Chryseobacterium sp. OV279 TaxID=1500285 RepID=UPI00091491EC|nr:hypothetical protein [Chryseobacterium sp. OV279]SHG06241.1 hypothetical protein SAMN02787100_3393 [Chryseobacterium sp. OV279]